MDYLLREAIRKAKNPDLRLNQSEYSELMKWVKISSADGREATNALATAKHYNYQSFSNVWTRDKYDEDKYASMGTADTGGGGCYLTTACMVEKNPNFDDNCYELTILRNFRDDYMTKYHQEDILYYYKVAPRILESIDKLSSRKKIIQNMYNELIIKVISYIERSEFEKAYSYYKEYTSNLEEKYLNNKEDE